MAEKAHIQTTLESTGIYTTYFEVEDERQAPYIIWRGDGQDNFEADDTIYFRIGNRYEADYYFLEKDEHTEDLIETALIEAGYWYDKSSDMKDSDTGEYLIIYNIRPTGKLREDDDDED